MSTMSTQGKDSETIASPAGSWAGGRKAAAGVSLRQFKVVDRRNVPGMLRRNPLALLKLSEVKLLGARASTYCYNYPAAVQIETTSRCNLRCPMCPTHKPDSTLKVRKVDMPAEHFRAILDGWTDRIYTLHLFGRGEPLLGKSIFDLIAWSHEQGIPHVSITSNGVLLDAKRARELNRVGLSELRVSIDGSDQGIYEQIRGSDLERVVENLAYLRSISDIPISVNYLLTKENWGSVRGMPDLMARAGAQCLRLFPVATYDDSVTEALHLDGEQQSEYTALLRELERACEARGQFFIAHSPIIRDCFFPFVMAYVDVEGNITPCCRIEDHPLYNVLENGFFQAWNCKRMRSWRKALLTRRFPKKCVELNCIREWN